MKMLETIRKDKDGSPVKAQKLAYALGYLTHIAADQHIHPFVEKYAGPYYQSGVCRKRHRLIEVYQDILLYERNTGNDFAETDFRPWFDISEQKEEQVQTVVDPTAGSTRTDKVATKVSTPSWFDAFIQRAFFESYSLKMDADEAEKWVKGFGSIFGLLNSVGPYSGALKNLKGGGSPEAQEMKDWFSGGKLDYVSDCFEPAKEIAARYISAGMEFFQAASISDQEREQFLKVILDADLTAPLMVI